MRDAAILLRDLAGADPRDSTCAARAVPDYEAALTGDIKGLRIGVPKEYFVEGIAPEVEQAVRDALKAYEAMGARLVEISLPHTSYAIAAYYIVATAEASANLARYDGIRFGLRVEGDNNIEIYNRTRARGFGAEVKRRIMLGTFVLSAGYYDAYYLKGQKVRTLIRRDFERAFESCDIIATPVAPTTAFALGEKMSDPLQDVPLRYLYDIGESRGPAGNLGALRIRRARAADRAAIDRTAFRRRGNSARGRRLRAHRRGQAPRRDPVTCDDRLITATMAIAMTTTKVTE